MGDAVAAGERARSGCGASRCRASTSGAGLPRRRRLVPDQRTRGHLDEGGYLFVEGRLDDVIVRGGENMSPGEIEDVLLDHPAVAEAAVVGMPDDEWGERVGRRRRAAPGGRRSPPRPSCRSGCGSGCARPGRRRQIAFGPSCPTPRRASSCAGVVLRRPGPALLKIPTVPTVRTVPSSSGSRRSAAVDAGAAQQAPRRPRRRSPARRGSRRVCSPSRGAAPLTTPGVSESRTDEAHLADVADAVVLRARRRAGCRSAHSSQRNSGMYGSATAISHGHVVAVEQGEGLVGGELRRAAARCTAASSAGSPSGRPGGRSPASPSAAVRRSNARVADAGQRQPAVARLVEAVERAEAELVVVELPRADRAGRRASRHCSVVTNRLECRCGLSTYWPSPVRARCSRASSTRHGAEEAVVVVLVAHHPPDGRVALAGALVEQAGEARHAAGRSSSGAPSDRSSRSPGR